VLVPDDRQLLEMASVLRGGASNDGGEAGPHQDILQVPVFPVGGYNFVVLECGIVVLCVCECVFQFGVYVYDVLCKCADEGYDACVWLPPWIVSAPDNRGPLRKPVGEDHLTQGSRHS